MGVTQAQVRGWLPHKLRLGLGLAGAGAGGTGGAPADVRADASGRHASTGVPLEYVQYIV